MKAAGHWQREHNQQAAARLEQCQKSTLTVAKAICVPFVVGDVKVPRDTIEHFRQRRLYRARRPAVRL